jgi:alpha-tubulin suppressor-like RCC1 family protein
MGTTSIRPGRVLRALVVVTGCLAAIPCGAQRTAVAMTGGYDHSCVLTSEGRVLCWGRNRYGQLGDGTFSDRVTPREVAGLGAGNLAVGAGMGRTCAITPSRGVKCWGYNGSGQLGDGTVTTSPIPVEVVGLGAPANAVAAIASGSNAVCALMASGGAKCWGHNGTGALGDGTTVHRITPVDVPALGTGILALSMGGDTSCAILEGGALKCWGDNTSGSIGDGTTERRLLPVDVAGMASGVQFVDVGEFATCATTTGGKAWCWGSNYFGTLGNGTYWDSYVPTQVSGLDSGTLQVSIGNSQACALMTGNTVKCWGNNATGQVGDGSLYTRFWPVDVAWLPPGSTAVSTARHHSCAITALGGVKCWGYNGYGNLGDGTLTRRVVPTPVTGLDDADGDALPDDDEAMAGRNPLVKDNDVFTDARLFAMQQYRDLLFRPGEPSGVDAWAAAIGSGVMRERAVDAFVMSGESLESLWPAARLYFASFGRPPDFDGLVFNARMLRDGAVTREYMATHFAGSPEFIATYGALDDVQFVTRLYANVLGRAPDPDGLAGWVAQLQGGATRGQVVLGFSDSAEFQASSANRVFATILYVCLLKRSPDPVGFPLWVAYLDSGPYLHEYAIDAILRSAEYRARFLP